MRFFNENVTRENAEKAWEKTKETTSHVVTTVQDPEFQAKVKTGLGNAWEGIKSASQRTIDAFKDTDGKKPEDQNSE